VGERDLLRVLGVLQGRHFTARRGGDLSAWARSAVLSGDGDLMNGGSGGRGSGSGGSAGGPDSSSDAPLVLAGIEWSGIRDALLANALACRSASLERVLSADADAMREVEGVEGVVGALHGGEGGAEQRQQVSGVTDVSFALI